MNNQDEGATPVTEDANAGECKQDGSGKTGKHHWVWTDGIHKSWNQNCMRCPETRTVDPKKRVL